MKITLREGRYVWHCAYCQFPIDDTAGYIGLSYPDDATDGVWAAAHETCGVDDELRYAIGVGTARTPLDLWRWTIHLAEKPLMIDTDWTHLMRDAHLQALAEDGAR